MMSSCIPRWPRRKLDMAHGPMLVETKDGKQYSLARSRLLVERTLEYIISPTSLHIILLAVSMKPQIPCALSA